MSRRVIRGGLLLLFIAVSFRGAHAGPVFPTRSFIFAPSFRSADDTTTGARFLRQQGIWGNLAHGFHSANDRFGWSISFGGVIEFVEWERSQIYLVGDAEVLADTHNDISFNPRAIFWTEGFMFATKLGEATELQLGYIHRCHHDIDNLGTNDESNHEERTLIYGSAVAKAVWRRVGLLSADNLLNTSASVQWDQYVIRQDDRIPPVGTTATDVNTLDASLTLGIHSALVGVGDVVPYIRAQTCAAFYHAMSLSTVDARAEIGIELSGAGSRMDVFVGYEHLTDDFNSVQRVRSGYAYLGFRFIGRNVGL
ncbi:MAG: hypothetical protein JSS75_01650 [Bacteroidetes bacterium]|nr:hypothetical protein [Bacteroidota bacterium]